jgi:hypothetical protein
MRAEHLEVLVEEASMETFLRGLLPRVLGDQASFTIYTHQGKSDLLRKLGNRLRGYAAWLPENCRIVVIVDRDDEQCATLKQTMERLAADAHLGTRTTLRGQPWRVVNRIAIEELEAWYFGDWDAVCHAYPRVQRTIPQQAPYRNSDAIAGGTWEAFERVLQRAGYFKGGLRKTEAARAIGEHLDPGRCRSSSFGCLRDALLEAVS